MMTLTQHANLLALTLIEPYGSLIVHADKLLENRGWAPHEGHGLGERIAIHAGVKPCFDTIDYYNADDGGLRDWKTLVTSNITRVKGRPRDATMRFYKTKGIDTPVGGFDEFPVVRGAIIGVARVAAAVHKDGSIRVPKRFYQDADGVPLRNGEIALRTELLLGLRKNPWFQGPWGWVLKDVIALPRPVPCRGERGLWALPHEVANDVLAQVEAA